MKNISFLTSAALLVALFAAACTPADRFEYSGDLTVGVPVEGELEVKTPDTYTLSVNGRAYIYGVVDQVSVDVVVKLYDSLKTELGSFDGPGTGPEIFYFEAKAPGEYTLEVAPFKEKSGKYVVELKVVEPVATEPEKRADQLFTPFSGDAVPGAVAGVVRGGKLIFSNAYGMADLTNGIPFSTETPSNIGSVSKQFTAMAILQLERQGKLSLDDDVRTYIPELPDLGAVVTLRNMLEHTNGFREVYNLMPMTGWKGTDNLRREDVLEMLKRQEELQAAPGEEYNYNNSAFIMLATIVERISGQKFPEWMEEHVFGPLGMTSTVVRADPVTIIPGASRGYVVDSTGFKEAGDLYASYGAGGIYTTVGDFSKWLGNFGNPTLGDTALIRRLVTPDTLNSGDTLDYALGIALGEYRGLKEYNHGGADIAHRAMLVYFPEIDAGVAVLSNYEACPTGFLAYELANTFFRDDLEPEEGADGAKDSTMLKVPDSLLEAYAGKYLITSMGFELEYKLRDGQLYISIEGQPEDKLVPQSDSVFIIPDADVSIEFNVDGQGKVSSVVLSQGGADYEMFPYEPFKPEPSELKAYEGRYFSPELDMIYTLEARDTTLLLKLRNTKDVELSAIEVDSYRGDVFFISQVDFQRDGAGKVTSFTVSNGRTKGVRFEKQ